MLRFCAVTLFLAGLLAGTAGAQPVTAGPRPAARTVVALYWSSEQFPSNAASDAALREVFRSRPELAIDHHSEFLESDRFPDAVATPALREYIRTKYAGRTIDVVIAVSDVALRFALANRAELFPTASIVASSTSALAEGVERPPFVTGVRSGVDYRQTLQLIHAMHPGVSRVYVVAQSPSSDLAAQIRGILGELVERRPLTFITETSVDRLLTTVRAVQPGSVVFYIRHSSEEPGRVVYPADVGAMVAKVSPVPVYVISENVIGSGVVGGVVRSPHTLGLRLGAMAIDILTGVNPRDIPVETVPYLTAFDWRQLRRWNIPESSVPAGAEIRFRETNLWETYRWYILAAVMIVVLQGVMIAALVVQRARRRAAQATSDAILRAMPDMMFLFSPDGVYLDCYAPDESRLVVKREVLIGKHIREVMPADIASRLEPYFLRLPADRAIELFEYELPMPDGVRQYEARLVPSSDSTVLTIVRDITESRRAEAALDEANSELTRISRLAAQGEFAASLAHEVRQPLTTILMSARVGLKILNATPPDLGEVRETLSEVVDASRRAEEVIRRNHELFKHRTMQPAPLDINAVILESVILATARLRTSGVRLSTELDRDLPAISGDRIEIQQVLLNLIANAIDALEPRAPETRQIDLASARTPEGFVQVSVTDNGVGLGAVDVARMFRLSYTTKAAGSGVGLHICRSIVEAHGGQIWASPATSGGALVAFTLPMAAPGAAPTVDFGPIEAPRHST